MSSHSPTPNYSYSPSPNSSRKSSSRSTPSRSTSSPSSISTDLMIKMGITVLVAVIIVTFLIYIAGIPSIELHTQSMSSEQFLSIPNKILMYVLTIAVSAAGAYYFFRN